VTGSLDRIRRWWRHAWLDESRLRRLIDASALDRLEARVKAGESGHSGEIRVCVEAALPSLAAWRGIDPRSRAVDLFSEMRVWDTEHNNGVLIYLLLADRAIEIVADRGLARTVSDAQWSAVMAPLRTALAAGEFEAGLTAAVDAVAALLSARFAQAPGARDENELPDRPRLI